MGSAREQIDQTIWHSPADSKRCSGRERGSISPEAEAARNAARRWPEPSIVLLDDALSAVDTHTEAEILRALRGALAGRTAVISSHRTSAIRDASWIIVLEEGSIVEQGHHAELLERGGRYWTLLRRQQLVESIEEDSETLASTGASGTLSA